MSARRGSVGALQRSVLGAPQAPVAGPLFDCRLDLAREMLAAAIDYRACQRLEALGIEGRFVAELGAAGLIGAARVQISPDGRRWERPGPDPRLLIGVRQGGELIDIIAVSTSHPDQVSLRTGMGWALGAEAIEDAARAAMAGRPAVVVLHSDPLAWLCARGEGLVVLDWALALPELRHLGEKVTIQCEAGAGERLRARLAYGGLPLVRERPSRPALAIAG